MVPVKFMLPRCRLEPQRDVVLVADDQAGERPSWQVERGKRSQSHPGSMTASRGRSIDVESTHKRVYGCTKQGAEYGRFKGIRTLHPLLAHGLHTHLPAGDRH
jgi:hypothetical protein